MGRNKENDSMTRRSYTVEERATALSAMIAGESISHVATRMGIPEGTITTWRNRHLHHGPVGAVVEAARTLPRMPSARDMADAREDAREELGQLVGDYLTAGLKALRAQAEFAAERTWLEKQNAADLAIFHGVLADKLIRVLGSLRPVDDDEGDEEAGGT